MATDCTLKLSIKRKVWFVGAFVAFYVFIWCASWVISQKRFDRWVAQFSNWLAETAFEIKVKDV